MRRYGALISDLSICDIKLASVGFSSSRSYDGGRSGALLVSDARQEEDGEWQSSWITTCLQRGHLPP